MCIEVPKWQVALISNVRKEWQRENTYRAVFALQMCEKMRESWVIIVIGLRWRNSPMCTLSPNGYGAGQGAPIRSRRSVEGVHWWCQLATRVPHMQNTWCRVSAVWRGAGLLLVDAAAAAPWPNG